MEDADRIAILRATLRDSAEWLKENYIDGNFQTGPDGAVYASMIEALDLTEDAGS